MGVKVLAIKRKGKHKYRRINYNIADQTEVWLSDDCSTLNDNTLGKGGLAETYLWFWRLNKRAEKPEDTGNSHYAIFRGTWTQEDFDLWVDSLELIALSDCY